MEDNIKSGTETSNYAEKVVSDVLGNTEGIVWRGAWASILHVLYLLLPSFVFVSVLNPLLKTISHTEIEYYNNKRKWTGSKFAKIAFPI